MWTWEAFAPHRWGLSRTRPNFRCHCCTKGGVLGRSARLRIDYDFVGRSSSHWSMWREFHPTDRAPSDTCFGNLPSWMSLYKELRESPVRDSTVLRRRIEMVLRISDMRGSLLEIAVEVERRFIAMNSDGMSQMWFKTLRLQDVDETPADFGELANLTNCGTVSVSS